MGLRYVIAPLLFCGGCCLAALFILWRQDGLAMGRRWGRLPAWAGALGLLLAFAGLLTLKVVTLKLLALALVMISAGLIVLAWRKWRLRSWVQASSQTPVDIGLSLCRAGRTIEGLFNGRIGASEPLVSPGGFVCAAYESELRAEDSTGAPGPLVAIDRASPSVLQILGERGALNLSVHAARISLPPATVRRTVLFGSPAGAVPLQTEEPPRQVLCSERLLRLGDPCVAFGRMIHPPGEAAPRLVGTAVGPPLLIAGSSAAPLLQHLQSTIRLGLMGAALLMVAAWLMIANA